MVLEAVPADPSGALGKLDFIKNNEDVREIGLIEKARERGEIGLVSGKDHL